MDHVRAFAEEMKDLGIDEERISPILLHDYTRPEMRDHQLTARYEGTIR